MTEQNILKEIEIKEQELNLLSLNYEKERKEIGFDKLDNSASKIHLAHSMPYNEYIEFKGKETKHRRKFQEAKTKKFYEIIELKRKLYPKYHGEIIYWKNDYEKSFLCEAYYVHAIDSINNNGEIKAIVTKQEEDEGVRNLFREKEYLIFKENDINTISMNEFISELKKEFCNNINNQLDVFNECKNSDWDIYEY